MKKHSQDLMELVNECKEAGFTAYTINSDSYGYYVEMAGLGICADDYQTLAARTLRRDMSEDKQLSNAAMGLCGEAGEVCDLLKKHLYQGHELDRHDLAEELGDVAWYLAAAATVAGLSLGDIMQCNIDKLKARYPKGFEADRSINREV